MPVPSADRMEEYARKGVELLLRSIGSAAEQRMARRLVKDFGGPASPSSGGKTLRLSFV